VKTKAVWTMTLCVAVLGASSVSVSCAKEEPRPTVSAADTAAQQKAAADKAAQSKAAGEKAAADKAVAAKVAADKNAAEKASAQTKAEAAALPTDLVEMKAGITRAIAQLDLTMAKLDALAANKGDLDKPSKDALSAIGSLDNELQSLKTRADEMRNRGAAYFEAWEKQLAAMSTPEVVAIATKRKEELSAKYAEVLSGMQESRAALDAYEAEMKPIQAALDEGLTPDKHKLLAGEVKSAKEKAATLKSRIDATFQKLNQVSLIYSSH
jgi:chromosome segregation ATPase